MPIRRLFPFALVTSGALVIACVGSDPDAPTSVPTDGGPGGPGSDSSTTTDGATKDDASSPAEGGGRVPTCAGGTFGALVAVSPTSTAYDAYFDLRLVGKHAYYSARPKPPFPPEGIPRYFSIVIGNYHPSEDGGASTFDDEALDYSISGLATTDQRSPTVSGGEDLLVYASPSSNDAADAPRNLFVASRSGNAFGQGTAITSINLAGTDQADPWLVAGQPATALYFTRGDDHRSGLTIHRSAVTQGGANATFEADQTVAATCPLGENCEYPVVTRDQRTLFYARWKSSGTYTPAVYEMPLDPHDGVTSMGDAIEHKELAEAVPNWVSDDGCDIIVAQKASFASTFARAHRDPK